MTHIFFYIAASIFILSIAALAVLPLIFDPSPIARRMLEVVTSKRQDRRTVGHPERLKLALFNWTGKLRITLGLGPDIKLRERLLIAGFDRQGASDVFFAAQFLTPLAMAFAGSFMTTNTMFWVGAFAVIGYVAPDLWLTMKMTQRKNCIRRGLPDAIDLLVICVDAGLGLDQALLRVGQELELSHPEIHHEFNQAQLEQRAGVPRLEVWQSLANRTRVEEFASFVSMLTQTERFGTPIAKALSRFADDLRLARRQRAEEAAAKTKIKIVFPLVLCIFPCLFIVLLAPAIFGMMSSLKGMGN